MSGLSTQLSNIKTRLKEAAKEAGNVLFMILIAVALFAALAYAVTQSTRSGGGDASKEKSTLDAAQITQYGTEIQTAIMRMKVSNNCTDEQISFENPTVSGYTNPNAPANYTCHVFRPEGGNVVWQKNLLVDEFWDSFVGTSQISGIGLTCDDAPCSDLLFHTKVSESVCFEINKRLGLSYSSSSIAAHDGPNVEKFRGTFLYNMGRRLGATVSSVELSGKQSACFYDTNNNIYGYYQVLLPR